MYIYFNLINTSRKFEGKGINKNNCLLQEKGKKFERGNVGKKDSLIMVIRYSKHVKSQISLYTK